MATDSSDHDAMREQAALFVLGALTAAERAAVEAHVSVCPECAAEVRSLLPVVGSLAQSVPQHDPLPRLRDRVLATARGVGSRAGASDAPAAARTLAPWLSAAALLVLTIALGAYAVSLQTRIAGLELRLGDAMAQIDASEQRTAAAMRLATSAETRVAVLIAPDVARIDLAGQTTAPRASARAFWSRARGLVLTASNLPPLSTGRTYQLWVVTAQAPLSAGILKPDQNGQVTVMFETPVDIPEPVAMAVTVEPEGGVPSPTGEKYLVGTAR